MSDQTQGLPPFRAGTVYSVDSSQVNSLESLDAHTIEDGTTCWVEDPGVEYQWLAVSTQSPTNPTIVLPADWDPADPGRWIRNNSGNSLTVLTNTVWLDAGSVVQPQTGSIGAPFTTLQAAIDYLQPRGGGSINIVTGTYGPAVITSGDRFSFIGISAGSQTQDIVLFGIDATAATAALYFDTIYLTTDPDNPTTLRAPNSYVQMRDSASASEIEFDNGIIHNSLFSTTINCTSAVFRDCELSSVVTGNNCYFYDCVLGGNISVAAASFAFMDTVSNYWFIVNGGVLSGGGAKTLMYDVTP